MDVFFFVLGIAALIVGAELVVRHGTLLARRLGVPPIIVGLTIVSIGTSIPELAVGIDGMVRGHGNLVLGNIVGTDIVNMLLIFGLMAVLRPVAIRSSTLKIDLPAMTASSALVWLLSLDGQLHIGEGIVLLLFGIAYLWLVVGTARRRSMTVPGAVQVPEEEKEPLRPGRQYVAWEAGLLLVGLVVTVLGADWMLDGAVGIAEALGVSDTIIGLTVVAIGTSAPELATAITSTVKGQDRGIAVGNLIGSSAMNPTIILGGALLFGPASVEVAPALVNRSMPLMVITAILMVPVFLIGKKVTRLNGALMVTAYAAYLTYVVVTAT